LVWTPGGRGNGLPQFSQTDAPLLFCVWHMAQYPAGFIGLAVPEHLPQLMQA
jgi:hypothetical protein